jgi:hypothetical protein
MIIDYMLNEYSVVYNVSDEYKVVGTIPCLYDTVFRRDGIGFLGDPSGVYSPLGSIIEKLHKNMFLYKRTKGGILVDSENTTSSTYLRCPRHLKLAPSRGI